MVSEFVDFSMRLRMAPLAIRQNEETTSDIAISLIVHRRLIRPAKCTKVHSDIKQDMKTTISITSIILSRYEEKAIYAQMP